MDRISKALEMARQKRGPLQQALQGEQLGDIEYRQTKVVEVDKELLRRNKVLGGVKDPGVSDAYGMLRTRVLQRMRQNGWKTLGITSANPEVGKTLTSINLSISIAQDHSHSVLLVDADLRRPSIHKVFGLEIDRGLDDYLLGNASPEEIMINPGIEHFVILPGNKVENGASVLLSSPRMGNLVGELRERYPERFVLFDLPPVLVGDDVLAFSPNLDAVLLVVEDEKTRDDELKRAMELLEDVEVLGTVLNRSTETTEQYGYYN
ncbi:MAG TPA: polysaccharide biosynthesis tyrosine autokinase [Chromatiales bacterium]|nr:polysaccharide biosynthesis tyrosine autokinase [Chromatiales bacterium]